MKNPAAVALGSLGGEATARNLTPEKRRANALKAGKAAGKVHRAKARQRKLVTLNEMKKRFEKDEARAQG